MVVLIVTNRIKEIGEDHLSRVLRGKTIRPRLHCHKWSAYLNSIHHCTSFQNTCLIFADTVARIFWSLNCVSWWYGEGSSLVECVFWVKVLVALWSSFSFVHKDQDVKKSQHIQQRQVSNLLGKKANKHLCVNWLPNGRWSFYNVKNNSSNCALIFLCQFAFGDKERSPLIVKFCPTLSFFTN